MRGIVSVTLFPIIFYGLGAGGRDGFFRLLISEPVFLEVCMPRVRERQHVERSVSRLWLFNFQLAGGGSGDFGVSLPLGVERLVLIPADQEGEHKVGGGWGRGAGGSCSRMWRFWYVSQRVEKRAWEFFRTSPVQFVLTGWGEEEKHLSVYLL